jgi:quinol monooxygenase YgiN
MYLVCVTIKVKPEHADEFVKASLDNASNTRREPGCRRFDVLRAEDDPNRFFFYEAYRTKDDFLAHQQTAHYLRWRDTVNPWMAEPRVGVKHRSLDPPDAGW